MFEKFYFTNKIHALNRKKLNNKKKQRKKYNAITIVFESFFEHFGFGLDHFPKMSIGTFRAIESSVYGGYWINFIDMFHTSAEYTGNLS